MSQPIAPGSGPAAGAGRLVVDRLKIEIGATTAVRQVSLTVAPNTVHCLVGESGSGKTMTSLAAVGLLPRGAVATGSIRHSSVEDDLLDIDQSAWTAIRGSKIGYVGQNALGCLHPAYRVGSQLVEAIRRHQSISKADALTIAIDELAAVDLPDPERIARAHPAQLSGGMCQRVALAIALCNRPSVLIADEPTTALDDDTQNHILELIRTRVERDDLSVLLITHDHRVVDEMADDITMIANGVSATQPTASPTVTTKSRADGDHRRPEDGDDTDDDDEANADAPVEPALEITAVGKTYGRPGRFRKPAAPVLQGVTITAEPEETIGLVGRSGAGKTTLAQIVAGVLAPSEGSVRIGGRPITGEDRVDRLEKAGLVQYVFQDPFGSLNPRRSALAQVAEPLIVSGVRTEEAKERAHKLLSEVGLTPAQIGRLPTALSGGQCQRVGIARALIRRPTVVVLDEPVSALDWSIRAEILDVLGELQRATGVTYLLISHEPALIERESDRVFQVSGGTVNEL